MPVYVVRTRELGWREYRVNADSVEDAVARWNERGEKCGRSVGGGFYHQGVESAEPLRPLPVVSACCEHPEEYHETEEYRGSKPRHCLAHLHGEARCACRRFHR